MYPTTASALPDVALEELLNGDGPGGTLPVEGSVARLMNVPGWETRRAAARTEGRDYFRALVTVN